MLCPNYVREIISMRALCQIKLENYVNTEGIMAPKVPRVKKKREVLRWMAAPSITR